MITNFSGTKAYLSNFFPSPFFYYISDDEQIRCATVEHGFQALKTEDRGEMNAVLLEPTPGRAKRAGRRVTLRPHWDDIKIKVMHNLVFTKFLAHPELLERLLGTGDVGILEGNRWCDNFWGRCLCAKCYWARGRGNCPGHNHLGKILMDVRDIFRGK